MKTVAGIGLFISCCLFLIEVKAQQYVFTSSSKTYKKHQKERANLKGQLQELSSDEWIWSINSGPLKGHQLYLYPSQLISTNYKISSSSSRIVKDLGIQNFEGYLIDHPNHSKARITMYLGELRGYVVLNDIRYHVEPDTSKTSKRLEHIWYAHPSDKAEQHAQCGALKVSKQVRDDSSNKKSSTACRIYQVAIALDYSYVQKQGSADDAIAQSMAIMNMVAGDYDDTFSVPIQFEIVEHYVSTCPSCDPWVFHSNAETFMNNFGSWSTHGFTEEHDIAQLWTDHNLWYGYLPNGDANFNVVGFANDASVCSGSYQVLEHYTDSDWALRVLTSHEFGHNFGASHDPEHTRYIMSPTINLTSSWSHSSTITINGNLMDMTCYADCISDDCWENLTLTAPLTATNYTARSTIATLGPIGIQHNLGLSAPEVSISPGLSLLPGNTFTIDQNACK